MRKILVLGSAVAGLALALFAITPDVARGAPVLDQATIESAVIVAVPAPAIVVQDARAVASLSVESVVVKDVLAFPQKGGIEVVALCTTLEQVPIVIVGVAHKCRYAQEVVTVIKMDLGVVRYATAIFGDRSAPEMMVAAVETRARYTVLRM